ncbi:MAG TPA: RNA-guided endonuclease TnpB family protein [Ktedonobacterales bacterium]|nr:RNA-guided endonuclease TnpB family protein [Ktedonobacterales bacterium]
MVVQRAYRTELDLNHQQLTACRQHAGAARFAYNWGLARKQEAYKATGKSPSAIDLHRELNALKQTEWPWMYAVSKCAPQEALRNLDAAFAHFFRRCQRKRAGRLKGKLGYPQRKTKKTGLGSFRLTGTIVVFPDAIQLPRLRRLRLKERGYLPVTGTPGVKVRSATVSEQAGHWYVSVAVEQEQTVPANSGPVVGVDLGVKALATLSDGTVIANPKPLKRRLKELKRLHRAVSRKQKGSKNRKKAVRRLSRAYRQVANQRANTLHQVTTWLAKTKSVTVIEDLYVAGMLKNHHLAQAIADVGFVAFRRQLTYKAAWYGSQVVVVSRWEPSSKTCSGCGWVDEELTLADRVFHCRNPQRPNCALVLDRDHNAATNLRKLAGSSSESRNACGGGSAGQGCEALVKLPTQAGTRSRRKQEPNTSHSRA